MLSNGIEGVIVYKKMYVQYMNIKKKNVGFRKIIKRHGFLFHCDIWEYTLLGITYVAVIWIFCGCYACLIKWFPHRVEVKISQINIDKRMQIKTVSVSLL